MGNQLVDDVLLETFSDKLQIRALNYLLSKDNQKSIVLFQDLIKNLGGIIGQRDSKIINVINELEKDSLIKFKYVRQFGKYKLEKAIRLTKLGYIVAKKLLYEGYNPNEIHLLETYRELPQNIKKTFIKKFLTEFNKKRGALPQEEKNK